MNKAHASDPFHDKLNEIVAQREGATHASERKHRCAVCGRGANEAGILHRVSRKGDTKPVIWICRDHFNYEDWKAVEDNDERLARRAAHASEPSWRIPNTQEEYHAKRAALMNTGKTEWDEKSVEELLIKFAEGVTASYNQGFRDGSAPAKLLRSRDRWRKIALLCMTLLAAGCVMFIVQCAKLP